MQIQQVVDYVFKMAPNPPWARENIYEIGNGVQRVTAVGVAWWITSEMLRDFGSKNITLGITHERVLYDLPETYHWGPMVPSHELGANQRILALAAAHGITIHRFHSNLDVADWGMPRALIAQLGWENSPTDWSRSVPVVEREAVTLRELINEVKEKLRLPFVRYDGDLDRIVRRIALPWGGLCQTWSGPCCAAPLGFDVLIGGDIIDGVVRLAREEGWAVIDAMHHATEMEAMRRLAIRLRDGFPDLEIHYYENTAPWRVFI